MTDTRLITQEEIVELYLFKKSVQQGRVKYWDVLLDDWQYDDVIWEYTYNTSEIVFSTKDMTAEFRQYVDWEDRVVSKFVKSEDESLEKFLLRCLEQNEKLWKTICFETR